VAFKVLITKRKKKIRKRERFAALGTVILIPETILHDVYKGYARRKSWLIHVFYKLG
jgi:hypothetical protein